MLIQNKNNIIRSPFFYVGDKYKLMPQLKLLVPDDVNNYIEPFVGGGSSFLNSKGNTYIVNDIDEYVIKLHKELNKYKNKEDVLFEKIFSVIKEYNLSCSYLGNTVANDLKMKYPKTYYAKHNKEGYMKLRHDFNIDKKDIIKLYVLLIYGFNHMIRFNRSGEFNLPVGNVDFNQNTYNALVNYLKFSRENKILFFNQDYKSFLLSLEINNDDYIFLDPPYLISMSEYNKLWNVEKEKELCNFLDELNKRGLRFGITNLIHHKGKTNHLFLEWSKKYKSYDISSNYISFNDNTIKENSREVFVTNYEQK